MAVGNPYGKGAYGAGPYARYGTSRPYGVGAYGTGPYSSWAGGNTFLVGAATGITFGVHAPLALHHSVAARTSISFAVWSLGMRMTIHPEAVSGIVFTVWSELGQNWGGWQPCETGQWAASAACEGGTWPPAGDCSQGTWTVKRLEDAT